MQSLWYTNKENWSNIGGVTEFGHGNGEYKAVRDEIS
jgi:hypothetical protein